MSVLRRHHRSDAHRKALATLTGDHSLSSYRNNGAPSIAFFKGIFTRFREGTSCRDTFTLTTGDGLVGPDKARQGLWCLSEARVDGLRAQMCMGDVAQCMRDERRTRLFVRLRTVDDDLQCCSGYIGQTTEHDSSSLGIVAGTEQIYRDFCTRFLDPPPGAAVVPEFLEDSFNHLRNITEAVAVDSASNEITSVDDSKQNPLGTAFLPNLKHKLRDSAHSARRLLERLWRVVPILAHILGLWCHDRDSISQLIHHSEHLQAVFAECCKENTDAGVSTKFRNMRSAKHRIETYATPLSRIILHISAVIGFAVRMTMTYPMSDRRCKVAKAFLSTLHPEVLIIGAMMADAAAVVMYLIRSVDTEALLLADLCRIVQSFQDKIWWMIREGGVFVIDGHVAYIPEWLKTPHFFRIGNTSASCIGGCEITSAMKNRCLEPMQTWMKLAQITCQAEFPDFSLVCAYSVFTLSKQQHLSLDMPPGTQLKLDRLSNALNQPNFSSEFKDHIAFAASVMNASGHTMDCFEAWGAALKHTEAIRGNVYPCKSLKFVLKRGVCFTPVTSGIEQSFTTIEAKLGSRRFYASSKAEARAVGLLVMKSPSAAELRCLCERAQQVWMRAFPSKHARRHVKKRADDGARRKRKNCGFVVGTTFEKTFRRRLVVEVDQNAHAAGMGQALKDYVPGNLDCSARKGGHIPERQALLSIGGSSSGGDLVQA